MRNVMIGREGLHRSVLVELFETQGAAETVSYIATGNVGFTVVEDELDRVVAGVEAGIEAVIGRHEPLYIRSLGRLAEIAARDPFSSRVGGSIHERLVSFTHEPAVLGVELPMVSDRGDYAVLEVEDHEIYSVTMLVGGRTRSPGGLVERLVGDRITTRSWNTVQRIVAKEQERT